MDKWKTLNEVPKVFRILDGGRLSVEQCNLIYKDIALKYIRKLADGREDLNYSKAREEFKKIYEKKKLGNTFVWIAKGGNGSTHSVEGGEG